eukprot:COSAG01_NODE_444_length_16994_cov_4.124238_3_plen_98_part_00
MIGAEKGSYQRVCQYVHNTKDCSIRVPSHFRPFSLSTSRSLDHAPPAEAPRPPHCAYLPLRESAARASAALGGGGAVKLLAGWLNWLYVPPPCAPVP